MGPERKRPLRCAIYTRKSSEEGLEQAFNSLAAQREACAAFIHSQRHEGWRGLDAHYDDGGYSGATLERPALKRLLADLATGKLEAVVVYKVDRLTRSLTDFAKIVEAFDARGIAFVSVTQQFNTTGSMGRLTLNVLLSFAQFEREVTAERIRDKFAASKRKGLWMGGRVPLGYDLKARQLVVNDAEAQLVRSLYQRYLELGCVSKLSAELNARGVTSKRRVSRNGAASGAVAYSRGALYALLKNPLYLGEIAYRGQVYPGNHEAILARALWERVQQQLASNRKARREGHRSRAPSLLLGLVYDQSGQRYTPSHTVKNAKRYRYYVAAARRQSHPQAVPRVRIPAADLESVVVQRLLRWLGDKLALLDALSTAQDEAALLQALIAAASAQCHAWPTLAPDQLRALLRAVIINITIGTHTIVIALSKAALRAGLLAGNFRCAADSAAAPAPGFEDDPIQLTIPARPQRCGREVRLMVTPAEASTTPSRESPALIKALAQGHAWGNQLLRGEARSLRAIAKSAGVSERYVSQVVRSAFLAPDLVEAVLQGRQPAQLTLRQIMQNLPLDWNEQRRMFGFAGDAAPTVAVQRGA
jgi:DNA invertase Pin-like site-specific DNA recombinase